MNKTKIEFLADIDTDLDKMLFTFKENTFKLNALELGFDGRVEMPKDDIDIVLTYALKKADFKDLLSLVPAIYMQDFDGLKTAGKLAFKGDVKGIYNDNNLPAFSAHLLVEKAMFQYPDLPSSVENINVDIHVKNTGGTGDNNFVDIKRFHLVFISISQFSKIPTPI